MAYTTELRIDPAAIREFVHQHVERIRDADMETLANGFRVKFGRPMLANEAVIVREAYAEADALRQERLDAEFAEAEARKPKGFDRVLASTWGQQTAVGTILLVVAMYWLLGVETASQIMFYVLGVTQGMGLVPLCLVGWALMAAVVQGLRRVFNYRELR